MKHRNCDTCPNGPICTHPEWCAEWDREAKRNMASNPALFSTTPPVLRLYGCRLSSFAPAGPGYGLRLTIESGPDDQTMPVQKVTGRLTISVTGDSLRDVIDSMGGTLANLRNTLSALALVGRAE